MSNEIKIEGFKDSFDPTKATVKFVLEEADALWKDFREFMKKQPQKVNSDIVDKYYGVICKNHPDFHKTYPLVLRLMIQMFMYNHNAFEKYLNSLKGVKWANMEESIKSAGDYYKFLLMETNKKHMNLKEINNKVAEFVNTLLKEHNSYKEYVEKLLKDAKMEESEFDEKRKDEILRYLEKKVMEQKE